MNISYMRRLEDYFLYKSSCQTYEVHEHQDIESAEEKTKTRLIAAEAAVRVDTFDIMIPPHYCYLHCWTEYSPVSPQLMTKDLLHTSHGYIQYVQPDPWSTAHIQ